MIETAKKLNEEYAANYGGKGTWEELSGFLKNSNISSADFNEVIAELSDRSETENLAELEHIRWCRFHYLNYWKQGVPDNGKVKDIKNRIHKNLIPYAELSEDDKNKCRDVVSMAVKRKNRS
ncbi:RyR domain-containing protein [Ruminococcus sp.]|uniref:RyR domain-containing protein n=1 Tax=Ruminococcus sp. TaxID=41978 RepID=UPI0025D8F55C|nr:RyR domain-containing protein [Ruminococcus sp.]